MGVMPCYRTGCKNILCGTRILDHYICGDCEFELREFLNRKFPNGGKKGDIAAAIEEFFSMDKLCEDADEETSVLGALNDFTRV